MASRVYALSEFRRLKCSKMCNRVIAYAIIASVACFTFLSWTCRDASPGYLREPTTAKPSNVPRASTAKPAFAELSNNLNASTAEPTSAEPPHTLKTSTAWRFSVGPQAKETVTVVPDINTSSNTKIASAVSVRTVNNTTSVLTTAGNVTKVPGWKLKNTCDFPLRVLYFVHTAPDHFDRRRVLRDTIGNPAVAAFVNSTIVFFVGKTSNAEVSEEVRAEAECEGDLVLLDHVDTYRNLTLKFIGATKWLAANRCLGSSTDVIVKLDDDVIVNVFLLAYYIKRHMRADARNSRTIHCATMPHLKPIRDKKYKWFVSKKEYANDTYPPYCCGAAYLMKASVLALLGEATGSVPFFWVDDVYSTGLLTNATNVTLVNLRRMYSVSPSVETTAIKKKTLFLHWGQRPVLFKRVYRFWASVLRQHRTT